MGPVVLHRASWVAAVSAPVISDGGVATEGDRILSVAPHAVLVSQYPDATIVDHGHSVLAPALVNAHIHLELSHITIPTIREAVSGFTDWIESLLTLREEKGTTGDVVAEAAVLTLQDQHRQGIAVLGDIGNTDLGTHVRAAFPGTIFHFNECLGRSSKTRRAIQERIAAAGPDILFTAHAPYSTHPELIRVLKKRAAAHNHPFPIHVAEPPSENELLCCGSGELHTFLRKRGFIDDSFVPPAGIDNPASVRYLHDLGILDRRTICVHCIHVTPDEVRLLADRGTKVCLCPGSNRYLRVGKAPVNLFLEHGILPALGTDSLASNPRLSLWREMNLLHDDNPEIDPARIFAMATLGGASALGVEDRFGTLAAGRSASFLSIPVPQAISNEPELFAFLTGGEAIQPTWVNEL